LQGYSGDYKCVLSGFYGVGKWLQGFSGDYKCVLSGFYGVAKWFQGILVIARVFYVVSMVLASGCKDFLVIISVF